MHRGGSNPKITARGSPWFESGQSWSAKYSSWQRKEKSARGIADFLKRQRYPTWGNSTRAPATEWRPAFVTKILRNPAVIGVFTPNRIVREFQGATVEGVPLLSQRIEGYFPAVVTRALFNLVQSTWVEAVKRRPRGRQANASDKQQENAIAGIAVCSECGSVMTRVVHGSRKTGRVSAHIVCSRAKNRRDCEYKTASLKRIEETLFQATAEWSVDHKSSSHVLDLRRQRDELLGQWGKLESQIIGLHTRSSSKVERLLERQRETGSQLASVERQLAATGVTVHRTKIKEAMSAVNGMRAFRLGDTSEAGSVGRANAALKTVLSRIVVRIGGNNTRKRDQLELHWLGGGVSTLEVK